MDRSGDHALAAGAFCAGIADRSQQLMHDGAAAVARLRDRPQSASGHLDRRLFGNIMADGEQPFFRRPVSVYRWSKGLQQFYGLIRTFFITCGPNFPFFHSSS